MSVVLMKGDSCCRWHGLLIQCTCCPLTYSCALPDSGAAWGRVTRSRTSFVIPEHCFDPLLFYIISLHVMTITNVDIVIRAYDLCQRISNSYIVYIKSFSNRCVILTSESIFNLWSYKEARTKRGLWKSDKIGKRRKFESHVIFQNTILYCIYHLIVN